MHSEKSLLPRVLIKFVLSLDKKNTIKLSLLLGSCRSSVKELLCSFAHAWASLASKHVLRGGMQILIIFVCSLDILWFFSVF